DGGVARAPRPEGDSLSCGCRVGPAPEPPLGGWSGLLLLGLVVTRLWRRRGRRNSNPWTAQ
ncbi:MAG: MYXO-CTERM sorting domain-containing protein, partial [Myxococcales bacterium]|nr:MYXO-CTERM sorting domain-containing protein [Myxococcales bacterium]